MSATGKRDCLVVAVLFILCGCFLIVLRFYGLTLPCPWPPDEIVYTQPAENLAKGKGMGVPACDDLLPGITKRAYLQVPVYFLAVSLWGRTFGFELGALRAFNQCLGVLGLILLFALARRWGLQPAWALLAVHWTGRAGFDLALCPRPSLGAPACVGTLSRPLDGVGHRLSTEQQHRPHGCFVPDFHPCHVADLHGRLGTHR